MKTYLIVLFSIISIIAFAQRHGRGDHQNHEKVESTKIAYITGRINLSVEQSQKFWPIYNEYSEKRWNSRKQFMKFVDSNDEISEDMAQTNFKKYFEMRAEELELEKKYFEKFTSILSYKQLSELYAAEREFNKTLMKRLGDFPEKPEKKDK